MYKLLCSKKSKSVFFWILVCGAVFQIAFISLINLLTGKTHEIAQDLDIVPAFSFHPSSNNYMNVCSLPVYDYWHPKVMKYTDLDYNPTENCDRDFKPYTELINGAWRIVDERKGMNCSARCFEGVTDWSAIVSDWMKPGPVNCEFLEAVCWEENKEVYGYLHSQIIPKNRKKFQKYSDPPNVFVILFDSMGTGQAKREMPKTLSLLNSRLESVEFKFVNKVGENSPPNGIPLLFGKSIELVDAELFGGKKIDVDWNLERYCKTNLNGSILEEFGDYGYMTLDVDDWMDQAVDYPDCNGFYPAPTDHYMHTFQLAYKYLAKNITKFHLDGHLCREDRHPPYEYFQDFIDTYKDKPKFAWLWFTSIGHDNMNGFARADQEIADIIERNYETFENSFFVFLSDHGPRKVNPRYLEMDIGSLEINNPYLSISIPKKLRKNQEILNIMRENSKKLQTHFDTRATLLDILKYQPESEFSDRSILEIPGEKGNSYLRHQPSFPRTCGHLPIPPEYCICQVEKTPITDEILSNRFGNLLIAHIHNIWNERNVSSLCVRYELSKVTSLTHFGSGNVTKTSDINHNYEIIIKTKKPSSAQFRTILSHNSQTEKVAFGNIVRLNLYGRAGDCTKDGKLEKICFCKSFLNNRVSKLLDDFY